VIMMLMLSANDAYMTEMLTLSGNDDQAMSPQKHVKSKNVAVLVDRRHLVTSLLIETKHRRHK